MSIFDFLMKKGKAEKRGENPELRSVLLSLERKEIVIEVDGNTEEIPAYASKIGGKPYLPIDFVWPVFTNMEDGKTRPLSFFCQINLEDVAGYDKENMLPQKGLLAFFYECESFCWGFDPADEGAAKVFYYENTDGFIPWDIPEDMEASYIMPEMPVNFSVKKSYPLFEEFEIYSDMEVDWDEYDEMLKSLGKDPDEEEGCHKLLGYADIIQGEMMTECERAKRGLYSGNPESYENTPDDVDAAIQENAKNWTLLLQLSTIEKDDFEWMFGDCGMIYFYIRKEDLAARRFDDMWFCVQCG